MFFCGSEGFYENEFDGGEFSGEALFIFGELLGGTAVGQFAGDAPGVIEYIATGHAQEVIHMSNPILHVHGNTTQRLEFGKIQEGGDEVVEC